MEWHAVDAADRWPGRWTAPGDSATYTAPGFHADIDGGYGQHWTLHARTLSAAQRRAVAEVLR